MAARSASPVAVFILVIGLGLMANPIYLTAAPDRGSLLIGTDRIPPAEGAAMLSPAAERQDDLQPVARYAARRALENGSITLNRSGPPLALQLFASKWRYLGSQQRTAVYRPTVEVGARSTTLRVKNVSLKTVESELGLTPPGRLNETDHPKEVAWLTHESDDVVGVGEFGRPWETRLERAIERGELTVPNGNNASMLHPLGSDVHFIVREDRFHRVALEETGTNVRLKVRSVSNETALAERTSPLWPPATFHRISDPSFSTRYELRTAMCVRATRT